MVSSPPRKRLTALQDDLLRGFFTREPRFYLTGGAALAGFYFGHRESEDLDLFSAPGVDLSDASRALEETTSEVGASLRTLRTYPDFRRFIATRGEERCIVDLVIDRAPTIDQQKVAFGAVRVDTLREIAANKLCTILSRNEIRDLVDLREILGAGTDLQQSIDDARRKDGGVDSATIAWVLSQLTIGTEARLPGGVDPQELIAFRDELIKKLRALAFEQARK
jgi:hypothetical protein